MSLARRYNRILKRNLLHYAAWDPLSMKLQPGDYGGFRGGVFQKLGNISEFGVTPAVSEGSQIDFDYTSSSTTIRRFAAGASVNVFPDDPVDAKLQVEFKGSKTVYIRSTALSAEQLDSPATVAQALAGAKTPEGRKWRLRYRVVRNVYTATNPTILAAANSDTKFVLSGNASALRRLEAGSASAEISVESSRANVLKITQGTGPVSLDLFRVGLFGGVRLEAPGVQGSIDGEPIDAEDDEYWAAEPEDDPEDIFESK